MPTEKINFDVVVVGSGPGGYKAAVTASRRGARVALIEKGLPGGTCLNEGCIPKKSLVYLAGLIEDVNALNGHGLEGKTSGDFAAALEHKDKVVGDIRHNFPLLLRRLGVKVFNGTATLIDNRHVRIDEADKSATNWQVLKADRIVLATGSRPRQHAACRTDGKRIINSHHFMNQHQPLPDSVLCLGGGTIGTELGYFFNQFGSRVTIVEKSNHLLDDYFLPERASRLLERKFSRLGVNVRTDTLVTDANINDSGVQIKFSTGESAEFSQVLVAIGRQANTEHLGLETLGVQVDAHGFIETNEYLETSVQGIFAVGDVKSGPMTANAALHDGEIAGNNATGGPTLVRNYHRVPLVIDSALEIASVGLTEDTAEDAGFEPDAARANYNGSAKALGRNDCDGFVEVVHDEETGQMLGGCVVGPEAGEQIQMLTAACQSPRGLWFLKDINYSHPSWCEELENAVDPYTEEFLQSGKRIFRPGIYAIND